MVAKFKNKYRIESATLAGYDYSQPGAYFITICIRNYILANPANWFADKY